MKKKITLLALNEEIAHLFKDELIEIFDDIFEIDFFFPTVPPLQPIDNTDLILCHDPEVLVQMMGHIQCDAPTLMMKRTISRAALDDLRKLPPGKKALVVSINDYATIETLTTIYQLGITQLQLYPFYQGMKNIPNLDYVIAPRDYQFIPDRISTLIIIGKRVFDISTVLDIIAFLAVSKTTGEKIITKHLRKVPTFLQGIKHTLQDKRILYATWKIFLNELTDAVIICNENNDVIFANNKIPSLLHIPLTLMEGNTLETIVRSHSQLQVLLSVEEQDHELIDYNDKQLVVTSKKIVFDATSYGKIITISLYNDMLKIQQAIHRKIVGKGYFSKYTFDHLIGRSPKLLETIQICKNIASSSSTALLTGESGTGKEIFAGAIHNHSPRSNKPFIAINCATLPENLLESELFGHEEGAFTGAKKGGKIGLFEMANQGTLFLDEIGEMPLQLQARFLRVLQEKEIIRVGGDSLIKVDVRIIAATNKDLWQMVEEGTFRKDLFFRINIFQIFILPLRERLSDIQLLTEAFLKNFQTHYTMNNDFVAFCQNYDWPGNVRELYNVLEYILTTAHGDLSFANLPQYLKKKEFLCSHNNLTTNVSREKLVLTILYQAQSKGHNTGRRSLHQTFNQTYYQISETDIRDSITALQEKGYLIIHKGRSGCQITPTGKELLGSGLTYLLY